MGCFFFFFFVFVFVILDPLSLSFFASSFVSSSSSSLLQLAPSTLYAGYVMDCLSHSSEAQWNLRQSFYHSLRTVSFKALAWPQRLKTQKKKIQGLLHKSVPSPCEMWETFYLSILSIRNKVLWLSVCLSVGLSLLFFFWYSIKPVTGRKPPSA